MENKLFYLEGNYTKRFGNDILYGILTIEEIEESTTAEKFKEQHKKEHCSSLPYKEIEIFGEGKFIVNYGSNWDGDEEYIICKTLDEAKIAYYEMEEKYCNDMKKLKKPIEEYMLNDENIPLSLTDAQKAMIPHIINGDVKLIN